MAAPVAVLASIGAGMVHAGVIGAHGDHVTLARLFLACAVLQLGWGVAALVRPGRLLLWAGVAGNGAAVAAWGASRLVGIGFIDGLQARERAEFADSACAALGFLSVVAAVVWLRQLRASARSAASAELAVVAGTAARAGGRAVRPAGFGLPGLAVSLLAVPALALGATHTHSHAAQAVAPKPYDPRQPVDLGGVPGVTKQQQARAEDLVRRTLKDLPHFADPAVAQAEGWQSIGDGLTGFEHYIKWSIIDDTDTLDPKAPESLVYQVTPAGKKLVSAMYILPPTVPLDKTPDVGGALTQWHVHTNLCFTPLGANGSRVIGLTKSDGTCAFGQRFVAAPMLHVWIEPNACGPFAALEGPGAGQILPGQTRLCDTAHGSH